jgi:membrane protein
LKIISHISQRIEALLTAPGEELGRWARFVRFQLRLWRHCVRQLRANNVTAMSAALCFRTIFALVPAVVLALLVLKSVGVLEDGKEALRQLLDKSGFAQITVVQSEGAEPADPSAEGDDVVNVADEIEAIVQRVESQLSFSRIGPVGVVLLIWTSLTLLTTMERSLNRIFGAERHRPIGRRVPLYWFVLTLGPLAYLAAAYAGDKASEACRNLPGVPTVLATLAWLGPVVVGVLVLAGVYKMLAHTVVPFRAAVGGALVAVPLWLVAKWAFAVYVTELVGTGNLYGALGLLPLFLIWLNVSWLVFLFGAELANAACNLGTITLEEQAALTPLGPGDLLAAAAAVAQSYTTGQGATPVKQLAAQLRVPPDFVHQVMNRLESAGIVCAIQDESADSYLLARPPEQIPVATVIGIEDGEQPTTASRNYDQDLDRIVTRTWAATRSALGRFTLADAIAAVPRSDTDD